MHTIDYEISLPYRMTPGNPALLPAAEVELFNGSYSARAVGIFDSGATHTGFSAEIAETLGIVIEDGSPVPIRTAGGLIDLYMFDLEMKVSALGERFSAQIGFFPTQVPRNILGRIVVFSKYQIGFCETAERMYFKAE
jgi:hypothetical protein